MSGTPIRTMSIFPVGDSLTEGQLYYRGGYETAWYGSYMIEMYLRLTVASIKFRTVGPQNWYVTPVGGAPGYNGVTPPTGWLVNAGDVPQSCCNYFSAYQELLNWLVQPQNDTGLTFPAALPRPGQKDLSSSRYQHAGWFNVAIIYAGALDILHGYAIDSGGSPGALNDPSYYLPNMPAAVCMMARALRAASGEAAAVLVVGNTTVLNRAAAVTYQNGLLQAAVNALGPWAIYVDTSAVTGADLGADGFTLTAGGYKKVGDAVSDTLINSVYGKAF